MSGTCKECGCGWGFHYRKLIHAVKQTCSQYPARGNVRCTDCHGYNGWHANGCPLVAAARATVMQSRFDHPIEIDAARCECECECGVDSVGGLQSSSVGGLHSSWCPRLALDDL